MKIGILKQAILCFVLFMGGLSSSEAQCKVSDVVDAGRAEMDPNHVYDGFSLTKIVLDDKPKRVHVKFVALKGQHYKIYFCNSGFKEEIKVSAFREEKNGQMSQDLLGTTTMKDEFIELVLSKAGNYVFEYHVPAGEEAEFGVIKEECMVALITYKK